MFIMGYDVLLCYKIRVLLVKYDISLVWIIEHNPPPECFNPNACRHI